ncbi:MAG: DUF2333 family protein [Alphaproteobacteria bacterium]
MAEEKLFSDDYTGPEKKGWLTRLRDRAASKKHPPELTVHRRIRWRLIKRAGAILMILTALYYPVGMVAIHKIDDDTSFTASVAKGQSHAVAIATALILREVRFNGWTANDPFFYPAYALDNMPNFQMGVIAALSRFTIEMADHIGRTRGSSPVDPDLDKARGLLSYSGKIWIFDFSTSWAPTASSEAQYLSARRSLLRYNERLAAGKAVFDRRSDNLQATVNRIAIDLGSVSAQLDQRIRDAGGAVFDTKSDDIFYAAKGRLYGYYMLLRALGHDYQKVIKEKQLEKVWSQMLGSLKEAAELQPLIVRNGDPDSLLQPNHLAAQGFYLLRSRTQIKEITNILLK